MTIIATHSGSHHADDVFGVAVLHALCRYASDDVEVIRTRDPERIVQADYAVDVGGIWDAAAGRFDHHQKGFDGRRPSGVLYASAGLVWAAHGADFVQKVRPLLAVTPDEAAAVAQAIDNELVQYLDMADTGAANVAPDLFGLSALLSTFNLTGTQERALRAVHGKDAVEQAKHDAFLDACAATFRLLANIVAEKIDEMRSAELVRNAERIEDGRIVVLRDTGLPWFDVVCNELPDVLFVVYPDSSEEQYQLRTVPVSPGSFQARKDLPRAWAGLRDAALAEVTGVADAVFVHNSVFIGGAKSLDGVLQMARLALAHSAEAG
jgi:uncharacterized UPF0160 family protein